MPMPIHLKLKGTKSGEIKGSCTQKGREGTILVYGFDHEIISPRDIASGLPTGKRQHKPIKILKEIDKASPILYQVLTQNENLTEVHFEFWKPSTARLGGGGGTEVMYYKVDLVNANISGMRTFFGNALVPENAKLPHMEEVTFTYQKITWTWTDGGITGEDDWEAPSA